MIPKVSQPCIESVIAKATQGCSQDEFAYNFLLSLEKEQPVMFKCLNQMSQMSIKATKKMTEDNIMDFEDAVSISSWLLTGILYKSLKGQIESNELNDQWRIE